MKLQVNDIVVDTDGELHQIIKGRGNLEVRTRSIKTKFMQVHDMDYLRPYFLQIGDYISVHYVGVVLPVRCRVDKFVHENGAYYIELKDQNSNIKQFLKIVVEDIFLEFLN